MASNAPLIALADAGLTVAGKPLFDRVTTGIHTGERLCVVGRNGSGKSSLLRVLAGLIEPDRGERHVRGGTTVRYLPQEPDLSGFSSVGAYAAAGLTPAEDPYEAMRLLQALGLDPQADPSRLSGGEARRAALARTLAPGPDVLILDEPTNHLDLDAILWLETELAASRAALVLVSHDRRFLERLTRATLWLDRGTARRLDQGFGGFEAWRDQVLAEEEVARHKLDRKIVAELDWLRYGVTARRKRNQNRLAGLHALRQQRRDASRGPGRVAFSAAETETSGRLVIEAKGLAKSYDGRPIVQALDLRLMRGDRLGLIGPNGAGKTTLLKLLVGELAPDAGMVRHGANVSVSGLDQKRDVVPPETTVREAVAPSGGDWLTVAGERRHVHSYLKDFLFEASQADAPVGSLSGGERGRLMLARAFVTPANLLVLDEPTNDLDLETLDLLQEAVADFPGTVLLVSHDRDFLDRTATSVLLAEGDGRWTEYAGGYSDMLLQRGEAAPARGAPASGRPAAARPATPSAPPSPSSRPKLSFKDKHRLEALPTEMARLEAEIAALEQTLADAGLFSRDPEGFRRAARRLDEARSALGTAEEEWLELEMKREALAAG